MAVTTTNLGVITAYGDAVAAGYTGTKAEWQTLMASYATVAEEANDAKDDAVAAKDTAVSKATEATTAANTATTKANEASASAQSIAQSASQITQNTSDISELKEELNNAEITVFGNDSPLEFSHQAGTILQNGTLSPASTSPSYAHYTSFIELTHEESVDKFNIKLNYGSAHGVYLIYATYLADGSVSTQRMIIDSSSYGTSFEYIVPVVDASAKYVRFCWFTYNDSTFVIYRDGIISKINESINYLLNKPTYNVYFTHQAGTILQNGTLSPASTSPSYAHYTSLIELGGDLPSDTFRIKLKYGSAHGIWLAYATYLADESVSSARIVVDSLVTDDDFEYIVAVSDANAKYVRFSWFTYNDSILTIYRDGILNRITELENGKQEYNNLVSQSKYVLSNSDTPSAIPSLTLMHVSDVHDNIDTMYKMLDVKKMLSGKVSDILHTGDTTVLNIEDGISNWVSSGCANSVLNVIGNHDAETEGAGGERVPYGATQKQCYDLFFKPYIANWGVVQPTGVDDPNSADYCACYYYKDYEESKIRLIVLDCYHWATAQLSWLESVLSDAITNQYSIVMASHVAAGNVTGIISNFTSTIYPNTNADEAYYRGLDSTCLEALKDYEDDGGEIIVWLAGHTHFDRLGVIDDYGIPVINVEKCSASRNIDSARIVGETNAYSFNILSVDKTNTLLKMVRYGATTDGLMRGKHVLCFNYSTKAVISEW